MEMYTPAEWEAFQRLKKRPFTKDELTKWLYEQKCAVAYTGVTVVKNSEEYLFETNQDSITMCNSQAIAFSAMGETATVDWKVYQNGFPVLLNLTKAQFLQVFSFGMQMINNAFAEEGELNQEISTMTDAQLQDESYIANFKARAESAFGQIVRRFVITAAQA